MKPFEEFLESIDPAEVTSAAEEAAKDLPVLSASSAASTAVTLFLLRKYHEWISSQSQ